MPDHIDRHFNWNPAVGGHTNMGSSSSCSVIGLESGSIFCPKKWDKKLARTNFCFYDEELYWLDVSRCARHHPSHVSEEFYRVSLFIDDFARIIDDFDHGGRPTPQKWPLNAPLPKVVWASKSVMCFGCSSWTNIACYLMQWRCLEGRRGHGFEWRRFLSHFLGQKNRQILKNAIANFCPKKWDKNGSTVITR